MSKSIKTDFRYLNRDGGWPGFHMRGLESSDEGRLSLYSLPLLEGELPEELASVIESPDPAGVAVDSDGTIYYSHPAANRVMKIDSCDGAVSAMPCIGGKGSDAGEFDAPLGLLIPKHRRSLFVADSNNHRVQVFDLDSGRLVDIWGQAQHAGDPEPDSEPGRFDTPWALAGDHKGNVYVVDYGNKRVQKFDRAGGLVASFWEKIDQLGIVVNPADIAVYSDEYSTTVFIVDETACKVFAFDEQGEPALDGDGNPIQFGGDQLEKPRGIAVDSNSVYVGDNARRRLLRFDRKNGYVFVGEAVGFQGPVAGLAFASESELLINTGIGLEPVRMDIGKGYTTKGVLWSEAINTGIGEVRWHSIEAEAARLGFNAHLRLFVHTSNDPADGPPVSPDSNDPFSDARWRPRSAVPGEFSDVDDLFIGGEAASFLWVGALFSGDGESTPVVSQMLVEFNHTTYLEHLPAIYFNQLTCENFLLRFLSLVESMFGDVEASIEDLSKLFDPMIAPKEFLPWLASWLGLELDEDWDEQTARELIASAFEIYGRRGTVEGLREALRLFAGVNAIIEEPIVNAEWWALPSEATACGCATASSSSAPCCSKCAGAKAASKDKSWSAAENSVLGVTTMLAGAHPQGAVVGSTATLDQSHLITGEQFGAPLFEDVAHQFTVQIYRGQLKCAGALEAVRAIIEREKPAHTDYHLCIIEPRLRAGFQARVGIDAVVAGPPAAMAVGEGARLGAETALSGKGGLRVGDASHVGTTTRVG